MLNLNPFVLLCHELKSRRVDPAETNNCYRLARSSGTATKLAEDYCFIHKALRPVAKARRQIAAVPPSNSRPETYAIVVCVPFQGDGYILNNMPLYAERGHGLLAI